jgi:hypothetical protein
METINGNYLTIELHGNGLLIKLKRGAKSFIKNFNASWDDLFEDIRSNSDWLYHEDMGNAGFGLTSAPGFTDGYYYDDNGEFTDKGNKDSNIYWYPNYMITDFFEELLKTKLTFFNKG